MACKLSTRENLSCLSKIELPHCSVDIYCGIQGNNRSLDYTEDRSEFYPKCKVKCQNESNSLRQKRKPAVESDLTNKDYDLTFKCVD